MEKKTKKNNKTVNQKNQFFDALAFIETSGKTGTIGALDIMPKTSKVDFVNRINIGSGMITVIYSGEVAAANSARYAAVELVGSIGESITSNVIPRPHKRIYEIIKQQSSESTIKINTDKRLALGMIETEGFTGMIEAADKGIKSADVLIPGWVTVGSGLTTVFFRGEVAAVHAAVESGAVAAEKVSKIISMNVIPQPHPGTEQAAPIGICEEPVPSPKTGPDSALGIIETRGISGLIEGIDTGLKAANIKVQGWEKIGRGITSTLFRGEVADVKTSVDAAVKSAKKVGKVIGSYVIASPHRELDKGR